MWRKSLIFDPGMLRARCYHKSSISKACAPSIERNRRGDPAGFFYVSKGQAFCQTFAPVIGSSTTSRCTSTRGINLALRWLDGLRVKAGFGPPELSRRAGPASKDHFRFGSAGISEAEPAAFTMRLWKTTSVF